MSANDLIGLFDFQKQPKAKAEDNNSRVLPQTDAQKKGDIIDAFLAYQPRETELDLFDYPEEVRSVIKKFYQLWRVRPPTKRESMTKYKLWIKEAREVIDVCDEFGLELLDRYYQHWDREGRKISITRLGSIKNMLAAEAGLARKERDTKAVTSAEDGWTKEEIEKFQKALGEDRARRRAEVGERGDIHNISQKLGLSVKETIELIEYNKQHGVTPQEQQYNNLMEIGMKLGYRKEDPETGEIIKSDGVINTEVKRGRTYENMTGILDSIQNQMSKQEGGEINNRRIGSDGMDSDCSSDCEICHGAGFVRYDVPIGHSYFGKVFPCPNRNFSGFYQVDSGLDASEYKLDWSAIVDINNIHKVVDTIREIINRGYGWITLWGGSGLAKTTLLKIAVAVYIRDKKKRAGYARMVDIIDNLRGAYDSENAMSESQRRLDAWTSMPLLSIDEFERINETKYASERKFVLADSRYEAALREKSITIIATNKNPEEYDGYLYDRMRDGRFELIHLEGKSARPIMTWGD